MRLGYWVVCDMKTSSITKTLSSIQMTPLFGKDFIIIFHSLVEELTEGGDVQAVIADNLGNGTKISPDLIWKFFIQTIKAIQFLHSINVMHRDIKPANMLLTENGDVKITGFGVSKAVKKNKFYQTQTGTPYYSSPEVWNDDPQFLKSDIWSAGASLYEMLTLEPPFHDDDMDELYKQIQSGKYKELPPDVDKDLKDLVDKCIKVKANQRPSAEQILSMKTVQKKEKELLPKKAPVKKGEVQDEWAILKKTIRIMDGDQPNFEDLNEPFRLPTPRYPFPEDKGKEQEANPLKKGVIAPVVERIPTPESKVSPPEPKKEDAKKDSKNQEPAKKEDAKKEDVKKEPTKQELKEQKLKEEQEQKQKKQKEKEEELKKKEEQKQLQKEKAEQEKKDKEKQKKIQDLENKHKKEKDKIAKEIANKEQQKQKDEQKLEKAKDKDKPKAQQELDKTKEQLQQLKDKDKDQEKELNKQKAQINGVPYVEPEEVKQNDQKQATKPVKEEEKSPEEEDKDEDESENFESEPLTEDEIFDPVPAAKLSVKPAEVSKLRQKGNPEKQAPIEDKQPMLVPATQNQSKNPDQMPVSKPQGNKAPDNSSTNNKNIVPAPQNKNQQKPENQSKPTEDKKSAPTPKKEDQSKPVSKNQEAPQKSNAPTQQNKGNKQNNVDDLLSEDENKGPVQQNQGKQQQTNVKNPKQEQKNIQIPQNMDKIQPDQKNKPGQKTNSSPTKQNKEVKNPAADDIKSDEEIDETKTPNQGNLQASNAKKPVQKKKKIKVAQKKEIQEPSVVSKQPNETNGVQNNDSKQPASKNQPVQKYSIQPKQQNGGREQQAPDDLSIHEENEEAEILNKGGQQPSNIKKTIVKKAVITKVNDVNQTPTNEQIQAEDEGQIQDSQDEDNLAPADKRKLDEKTPQGKKSQLQKKGKKGKKKKNANQPKQEPEMLSEEDVKAEEDENGDEDDFNPNASFKHNKQQKPAKVEQQSKPQKVSKQQPQKVIISKQEIYEESETVIKNQQVIRQEPGVKQAPSKSGRKGPEVYAPNRLEENSPQNKELSEKQNEKNQLALNKPKLQAKQDPQQKGIQEKPTNQVPQNEVKYVQQRGQQPESQKGSKVVPVSNGVPQKLENLQREGPGKSSAPQPQIGAKKQPLKASQQYKAPEQHKEDEEQQSDKNESQDLQGEDVPNEHENTYGDEDPYREDETRQKRQQGKPVVVMKSNLKKRRKPAESTIQTSDPELRKVYVKVAKSHVVTPKKKIEMREAAIFPVTPTGPNERQDGTEKPKIEDLGNFSFKEPNKELVQKINPVEEGLKQAKQEHSINKAKVPLEHNYNQYQKLLSNIPSTQNPSRQEPILKYRSAQNSPDITMTKEQFELQELEQQLRHKKKLIQRRKLQMVPKSIDYSETEMHLVNNIIKQKRFNRKIQNEELDFLPDVSRSQLEEYPHRNYSHRSQLDEYPPRYPQPTYERYQSVPHQRVPRQAYPVDYQDYQPDPYSPPQYIIEPKRQRELYTGPVVHSGPSKYQEPPRYSEPPRYVEPPRYFEAPRREQPPRYEEPVRNSVPIGYPNPARNFVHPVGNQDPIETYPYIQESHLPNYQGPLRSSVPQANYPQGPTKLVGPYSYSLPNSPQHAVRSNPDYGPVRSQKPVGNQPYSQGIQMPQKYNIPPEIFNQEDQYQRGGGWVPAKYNIGVDQPLPQEYLQHPPEVRPPQLDHSSARQPVNYARPSFQTPIPELRPERSRLELHNQKVNNLEQKLRALEPPSSAWKRALINEGISPELFPKQIDVIKSKEPFKSANIVNIESGIFNKQKIGKIYLEVKSKGIGQLELKDISGKSITATVASKDIDVNVGQVLLLSEIAAFQTGAKPLLVLVPECLTQTFNP